MLSKRDVLSVLSRDELLAIVNRFELTPPDRRAKAGIIETVASSKKATLAEVLPELSRDRLKEVCRALGIEDGGREKATLVARLVLTKPSLLPSNGGGVARANGGIDRRSALRTDGNGSAAQQHLQLAEPDAVPAITLSELESHLWEAANILRGSPVDRTDWKSYILPLLFFKRICDVWDEEHAAMIAEYGEGLQAVSQDVYLRFITARNEHLSALDQHRHLPQARTSTAKRTARSEASVRNATQH
jgi:type I restriction enzyme M protein